MVKHSRKKSPKRKQIDAYMLEHVVDWLNSKSAPARLRKLSVSCAVTKTNAWVESNKTRGTKLVDEKGDLETFMNIDNFKIVKLLTKNAFLREGALMSHCLGGYTPVEGISMFSLRDNKNNPHATLEVRVENKEVVQIKGKGNGSIHPRYIKAILAFLEKIGMNVRKEDMPNLGYYYIHKDLINYAKMIATKEEFHTIGKETFIFTL